MTTIATLMSAADPAATRRDAPLPPRAEALLAELLAAPPTTRPASGSPRPARGIRRGLVWAAVPVLAAGVVTAAVLAPQLLPVAGPGATADYPFYPTEAELVDAADTIVVARTVSESTASDQGVAYLVVTVEVTAAAKGASAPGDVLEVRMPASEEVPAAFAVGSTGVLFLSTYPDAPASPVNPEQGSYLVDADGSLTASPDNPVRLSAALLHELGL